MDSRSFDEDSPLATSYEQIAPPIKHPLRQHKALMALLFTNAVLSLTAAIYFYLLATTPIQSIKVTPTDCFDGETRLCNFLISIHFD
jgi:hypothetical protein